MRTSIRVALVISLAFVLCVPLAACGGSDEDSSAELPDIPEDEVYYHVDKVDDEGRHILSPQDVAPEVAEVQQQFQDWGLIVDVNGTYDDETLAAVLAFQYSQDLVPDGVIGPNTWDAFDDPQELPKDIDALEIVEIAKVALSSPSDARAMVEDFEERTGFKPGSDEDGDGDDAAEQVGEAGVYAVVSLGNQHVKLYDESDNLLHDFPVSSGANGLTPVGEFAVQSRDEQAWAPGGETTMQWMTRFNGGVGFHGIPVKNGEALDTPLGERPVSHGCVRMDDGDAKTVYDTLPDEATVIVRQ